MDNLYRKFCSLRNLRLALARLKTAQNLFYKNYYRDLFVGYELSKEKNLKNLHQRLKGHSYKPYKILKIFLPKPSGLHRPITFLSLDDLIIYQATCNVIADKFSRKRQEVEFENVFSYILNRDREKNIFFLKKWQEGYLKFIRRIKSYYNDGFRWVAHFDLAAYYDTICHESLCKQISQNSNNDFCSFIKKCLSSWSSEKGKSLKHGIPQGPISSDFIGEVYLLPIDKTLHKKNIKYVRYVDDIKIFGSTREEVLEGVILLEKECKERGLIPQSKKYEIIQAQSTIEAVGKNPSIPYEVIQFINIDKDLQSKLFKEAFNESNFDISKVRYILKASYQNEEILKIVIANLNSHPELINEYCLFLENYSYSTGLAGLIFENAIEKPSVYEYVEGKYWELLSKFKLPPQKIKLFRDKALNRLGNAKNKPSLRIGLFKFLGSVDNKQLLYWLPHEKYAFIQMQLMNHINPVFYDNDEYWKLTDKLLLRHTYDPTLMAIKEIFFNSRLDCLTKIKEPRRDDSNVLNNTIGIHGKVDTIGQIIKNVYLIPYSRIWHILLRNDYSHANFLLHLADKAFFMDKNSWVNYTDSFNDVLIVSFINFLSQKFPHITWPDTIYLSGNKKGEKKDFGELLDCSNRLSKEYPNIIKGIREFHKGRRTTPSSHAFEKKTGIKTKYITRKEQKILYDYLKNSYIELIKVVTSLK